MSARRFAAQRHHALAILAVVALLAQALVPHVHGRAGTGFAPWSQLASCGATACETTITTHQPTAADDTHQHAAGCPLCRAQSDARSLLLPQALAALLPTASASPLATEVVVTLTAADRNLAAPRAPPACS
jgi:hypothetical protein